MSLTRREILAGFAAAAAAPALTFAQASQPATTKALATKAATTRANDRPRVGFIGCGGQGTSLAKTTAIFADIVAVADVDLARARKFDADRSNGKSALYSDYRKLLERKDVDAVFIATPDHWHTKHCIDAMRAGKDVYCEKPLTLTIDEGNILCRVVRETSRVLAVGTQQRSNEMFQTAVALVHAGYLGRIKQVLVIIKKNEQGGPFPTLTPPAEFDWDTWLGQCPKTPYIKERAHYQFRWWYEYSGGRMTDWGAHHVDIAQWAAAPDLPGPTTIEPLEVKHPLPMRGGYPTVTDCYNTASRFDLKCTFANGVEMFIMDEKPGVTDPDNGILFVGEKRTLFAKRGEIRGNAVEFMKGQPLPESAFLALRNGRELMSHQADFFQCCRDRGMPISDVWSHHRHLSTCHLANIAVRLGRPIRWDATARRIVGDKEANAFLKREQRKGFEIA
jgi:predicted dehydrogenase